MRWEGICMFWERDIQEEYGQLSSKTQVDVSRPGGDSRIAIYKLGPYVYKSLSALVGHKLPVALGIVSLR